MGVVGPISFQVMCASNGNWLCSFKVTQVRCTYRLQANESNYRPFFPDS